MKATLASDGPSWSSVEAAASQRYHVRLHCTVSRQSLLHASVRTLPENHADMHSRQRSSRTKFFTSAMDAPGLPALRISGIAGEQRLARRAPWGAPMRMVGMRTTKHASTPPASLLEWRLSNGPRFCWCTARCDTHHTNSLCLHAIKKRLSTLEINA